MKTIRAIFLLILCAWMISAQQSGVTASVIPFGWPAFCANPVQAGEYRLLCIGYAANKPQQYMIGIGTDDPNTAAFLYTVTGILSTGESVAYTGVVIRDLAPGSITIATFTFSGPVRGISATVQSLAVNGTFQTPLS